MLVRDGYKLERKWRGGNNRKENERKEIAEWKKIWMRYLHHMDEYELGKIALAMNKLHEIKLSAV